MKRKADIHSETPCLNCVERIFGCHSSCKLYNTWKSELDESSEAERMDREGCKDNYFMEVKKWQKK